MYFLITSFMFHFMHRSMTKVSKAITFYITQIYTKYPKGFEMKSIRFI